MTTVSVPPGCIGVELADGTKVDANKQGKVVVDHPQAERLLSKSSLGKQGVISRTSIGFGHVKSNTAVCSGCGFTGWGWQKNCPKCSAEMIKETTE
jgi:hypothetical protein